MNEALHTLKQRAAFLSQYPQTEDLVKECEEAANLLESLLTSTANQVATPMTAASAHTQMANYAAHDAFMTMALFVGVPKHAAEKLLGLIAYIKEIEEKAASARQGCEGR